MPHTIDFLHPGATYTGETAGTQPLGGTESSVVQLAEAFARRGHRVTVYNGVAVTAEISGVSWRPFSEAASNTKADVGVAVASARAFRGVRFRTPVLWLHNPTSFAKEIRRGNMMSLLRIQPQAVLLGQYHDSRVPRFLPLRGRSTIPHGVHDDFFSASEGAPAPPPRMLFTSQPYRGLDWLLNLWPQIKAAVPKAEFHVFAPRPHQAAANSAREVPGGVTFAGSAPRRVLAEELRRTRLQAIPGHRDETYCLAAAEAIASGVPVVTLGTGALRERVQHGVTGFIADDAGAFADFTIRLLRDDALWLRMRKACAADTALSSWDSRASEWEAIFRLHGRPDIA